MSGPPWVLPTATSRYVVGFAPDGLGPLLQDWTDGEPAGPKTDDQHGFLTPADRLPLELAALGTRQVRGSDLVVDHGDGLVGARLVWALEDVELTSEVGGEGAGSRLTARALDSTGDLEVVLTIETDTRHDLVTKQATYRNSGSVPLTLPRAFGPSWELPVGPAAVVSHLAGEWGREFTPYRTVVEAAELSIGSRSGITSHHHSPTVVVSAAADPDGPAYGVALAWSGSWRLLVDSAPFSPRVRVAGGVDDESGVVTLLPGEFFRTPATLGVFAPDGPLGVQRRWHDHQRGWLARDLSPATRPVLYNSWYATEFDVRLEHQLALAEVAAGLGVEAFVVDDGWFRGRTSDRAGLGDWSPDPATFPDGLVPLADAVQALGMRFGIWVEPEAVNPDSDLYRAHPDWVYRAGRRPLVEHRHQYVLDLGRPEVVAWIQGWLRELLGDGRVSYLKWDMNRPVSDGGRPGDPHGRQWSVQHAEGYYEVLRMLRDEFPQVTVEACSGGGGRIDAAVLARTDVVWTSDETGPRDRLAIQHGFLSAYGPHVMSSWVTDLPSRRDLEPVSLEFRFVVAMAGVLGIGADLLAWGEDDRDRARQLVALYLDVRHTVHTGRVERHGDPRDPVYAVEYGGPEQTVVLVYGRASRPAEVRVTARTLRPGLTYRLRGRELPLTAEERRSGLVVPFGLGGDAEVLVLEVVA
ncbi:alpha-galactosidase [uncultured Friedmanniella sp.]|uniref:alpha-galactosidase n=1 Tax=uncultured Friedmanniella sp. TaxID=335381 RepID=UPI0035CB075F